MMFNESDRFEYLGDNPSSNVPIYKITFISVIFHCFFFFILPLKLTALNRSYIVSTFHAIVGVCSVLYFFTQYSVNLKQLNRIIGGGVIGTGDEIMTYSICYSIGYFIYDLILMSCIQSVRTTTAFIHHIVILLAASSGTIYRVCHPCHFYFLGEELSTIPLNLKSIYHHRPRLHQIFSYLFVFCFFLSRFIYGSIICGYAFGSIPRFFQLTWHRNDLISLMLGIAQATLCILTRILNFYWGFLILRKFLGLKQSKKKT